MDDTALANLLIRHHIASNRFGNKLADDIVRLLNASDKDLVTAIECRYAKIEATGFDKGPATTARLEALLEAIRAVNTEVYERLRVRLADDLADAAIHEASFAARAVRSVGGVVQKGTTLPSADFLRVLVERTPIPFDANGGKAPLRPWIERMEVNRYQRLEDAIRIGLTQGEATQGLVKRIRGTKAEGYQNGALRISRQSAQSLAITANSTVQNAARIETFKAMKSIGFVEWSSILDSRTSTICQSQSGKVYAIDEDHPTPPLHPRCFPGSTKVSTSDGVSSINRIKGVSKRWYDGNLVIITTATGKRLTCTPNHPILTANGFIAANEIAVGNDVVSYRARDGILAIHDDHKHGETLIEEVANAFFASSEVSSAEVPLSAEDFHGDALDGEIAVIGANWRLAFANYPTGFKKLDEIEFDIANVGLLAPPTLRLFALLHKANRLASHGSISAGRKLLAILEACISHSSSLLLTPVSDVDPSVAETRKKRARREANDFAYTTDSHPTFVETDRLSDIYIHQTPTDMEDTGLHEHLASGFGIDPTLGRAIVDGQTGAVEFDEVREVGIEEFHGFVYNLETEKGFYQAEGVVVHNCRSLLLPRRNNTDPAKHKPFGDWLRGQSKSVQEEVLGADRAKAFRDNPDFDFAAFFRKDGSYKSLDELRAFDAGLFPD